IADAQPRLALDPPAVGGQQTQDDAYQTGLAGAVGTDQGDDFAPAYQQTDVVQNRIAVAPQAHPVHAEQNIAHAASRQRVQSPAISTVSHTTVKPTCQTTNLLAVCICDRSSSTATLQTRPLL